MIDQRALDAACREFKEHLYIPGTTSDDERTAIKSAIEAYEAARWRPIEEMPEDRSKIVIWYGNALYHGEDFAVVRNAMFRTIDPPKQNQDKETPHALTE